MKNERRVRAWMGLLACCVAPHLGTAGMVEDFESYKNTAALEKSWADEAGSPGQSLEKGTARGSGALKFEHKAWEWQSIVRTEFEPRDWTGFDTLRIWIKWSAPRAGTVVVLQLKDEWGGTLGEAKMTNTADGIEWRPWEVDLRGWPVGAVGKITLGVQGNDSTETVYMDDVELVPGGSAALMRAGDGRRPPG